MTCDELQEQLDDRLDGRLDSAAMTAFDAHLINCAACRQHWREYADAWQGLAQLQVSGPSVGFAERTLRRLEQEPHARRWALPSNLRWALATVAAVAVVSFTWVDVQHVRSERQFNLYTAVRTSEQVEDLDVIAALHELGRSDEL